MGGAGEEAGQAAVARTGDRARADEWALVLLAEGLAPTLHREGRGWALHVPASDAERAAEILASYVREEGPGAEERPAPAWRGEGPLAAALAMASGLLAFHAVTGPWRPDAGWFEDGAASSRAIVGGEPWRVVTALTLHADAPHVLGNALAGGLLWTLVGRALGPGAAVLAVLVAGAGGNLLNALLRSAPHLSVGASTAVFGAVGALAGLGRGRGSPVLGRHPGWVSFAAALGVLAMLGTGGGRTDVWAHGFGVLAGFAVGRGARRLAPEPPRLAVQWACGAAAVALVGASWALARLPG